MRRIQARDSLKRMPPLSSTVTSILSPLVASIMIPEPSLICMGYQVSRALAAGRSLWKRAEPAAGGAGLDVGLLGRRGCEVLASPSGFGDLGEA
ncbi:uncharacterized protein K444DRAFT_33147 [Hyaloscypha bicolor E]|uniref:Uncharacterized protein n=1 Tax=Hyaloscypha bicolor E TaxID=1095630 RepID=A0A2J6T3V0_9HELO|nr:uncharacterized protein K444DRAFT_33147 [Hyaloscypha bicolor E]PMD57720.1 hypothetical protein K444DRAFT_33147 [Hyaloscypha bicolor E]